MNIKELAVENFPKRLKEIPDTPKRLFLEGILPREEDKWLCVVGSRKCTNYGREVTERIIFGLAGRPITIVSGLALGIDSVAHRAALSTKLNTIAIPGSGLDRTVLHPPSNRPLAEKILAAGGALLSEFEPTFPASLWSFPQRNRIMAGLSDAVLIIEAEQKSGTLITAKLAVDYNRDVLTVPGSIFSSFSAGPHMLLRLGATPVTSPEDVLQALGLKDSTSAQDKTRRYNDCSPKELEIIRILKEPCSRDELFEQLNIPIAEINSALSMMELKGLIKENAGEIHLI